MFKTLAFMVYVNHKISNKVIAYFRLILLMISCLAPMNNYYISYFLMVFYEGIIIYSHLLVQNLCGGTGAIIQLVGYFLCTWLHRFDPGIPYGSVIPPEVIFECRCRSNS